MSLTCPSWREEKNKNQESDLESRVFSVSYHSPSLVAPEFSLLMRNKEKERKSFWGQLLFIFMNVFFRILAQTPGRQSSIFIQPTQIYYVGITSTENSLAWSHLLLSSPLGLQSVGVWISFDSLNGEMVKAVTGLRVLVQVSLSSQEHGL